MAEKILGGKADYIEDFSKFSKDEILKGMKEEFEHTSDPFVALEIVMDHLVEDPNYYAKLAAAFAEQTKEATDHKLKNEKIGKALSELDKMTYLDIEEKALEWLKQRTSEDFTNESLPCYNIYNIYTDHLFRHLDDYGLTESEWNSAIYPMETPNIDKMVKWLTKPEFYGYLGSYVTEWSSHMRWEAPEAYADWRKL